MNSFSTTWNGRSSGIRQRDCWLSLIFASVVCSTAIGVDAIDAQVPARIARPWNRDLIYFVLIDRFLDGDPTNNRPPGSDPALHDSAQRDVNRYHGGDLRGLELAIRDGYFTDLGVTAIWITPPVRNAWYSAFDLGGSKTGYHGYWAQDFLDIDPHWVSRRSMEGCAYPDTRDGRMQHFRDLVALAHRHDIKVVQDVVCNHIGPLFYYDTNGNQHFEAEERYEWIAPFQVHGYGELARWADVPRWNLQPAQPSGSSVILGHSVSTTGVLRRLTTYGRKGFSPDSLGKSDGEEVTCDFFALRDVWTDPNSGHFDELVDEFVEIYRFYVEDIGIDGLRVDTVKHVHHEFWDAFTQRLRARLSADRAARLLLFGEVYDGDPRKLGQYTYRVDYPSDASPCLDSLLNFQFCFTVRDYLRMENSGFGSADGFRRMMDEMNSLGDRPTYNPVRGPDGLSARQKMVNFWENHDGLNRFLVSGIGPRQHLMAMALTLTLEGIPCLYYGSEVPLQDEQGEIGRDSETGRLTLCRAGDATYLRRARQTSMFRAIHQLASLRQQLPALHQGRMVPLWVDHPSTERDDGLFVFARYLEDSTGRRSHLDQTVIVAVNAHPLQSSVTETNTSEMLLVTAGGQPLIPRGSRLQFVDDEGLLTQAIPETTEPLPTHVEIDWRGDQPYGRLSIPPQSMRLLRVVDAQERGREEHDHVRSPLPGT